MTKVSPARVSAAVISIAALAIAAAPVSSPTSAAASTTVAHCTYSQLRVRSGGGGAASEHDSVRLRFRNTSHRSCSVYGYPGAAGLNKHGKQIEQAKRTKQGYSGGVDPNRKIPTVVLKPGQVATAVIESVGVTAHGANCKTFHSLLVTPPNDRKSVHLAIGLPRCSLQIHPVVKGTTGVAS
jgi:hypothetical protein